MGRHRAKAQLQGEERDCGQKIYECRFLARSRLRFREIKFERVPVFVLADITLVDEQGPSDTENEQDNTDDGPDEKVRQGLVADQRVVGPVGRVGVFCVKPLRPGGPGQPCEEDRHQAPLLGRSDDSRLQAHRIVSVLK